MTGWPTNVIIVSGSESWQRLPPEVVGALDEFEPSKLLRLTFDDTCRPRDAAAPTMEHVAAIIQFAERVPSACKLLSVCPGGFGRSSAASWICWLVWGDSPARALQRLLADRREATPNRLMIALADVAMDMKGALWATYSDWMRETVGVRYDTPVPLRGKQAARLRAGIKHQVANEV
ncbi:MAG: hypothetical protein Q7V57_18620 [Actinomycetota bacterium]|nr:hypothetical protein [Actinomycetota bacterium]